ncbi:hypothetical protein QMQ05_06970 [Glutamicibacter ectropisis]|uniref:Uncharacterized protein n=1 Tax=Glutamicibacter ectropisis TaxID=3046593 RepID=A0AAU6WHV2_9MICC
MHVATVRLLNRQIAVMKDDIEMMNPTSSVETVSPLEISNAIRSASGLESPNQNPVEILMDVETYKDIRKNAWNAKHRFISLELYLRAIKGSWSVSQYDQNVAEYLSTHQVAIESPADGANKYIVDIRSLNRARQFVQAQSMGIYVAVESGLYEEIREYRSRLTKSEKIQFNDLLATAPNLDVDWTQLMAEPNALAVLYNFSPYTDTGAVVASKRIRASGDTFDVIACSFAHRKKIDSTIERIAAPYVRSKVFLPMAPSWATWSAFKAYALKASRIAQNKIDAGQKYDYLYTRAMWAPSHYAGVLLKKANPGLKWVAEFSDPLSLDVEGLPRGGAPLDDDFVADLIEPIEREFGAIPHEERTIFALAELIAYAHASEIVFTNEHQKTTMLGHIYSDKLRQHVEEKSVVSNHPTLPAEFYEAEQVNYSVEPSSVNLAYFGEFYATRGLTEVTTAIRMLPQKFRDKVHLHVFTNYIPVSGSGSRPRGMSAKAYNDLVERAINGVGAHGIEDQVFLNGSLPYLKFLGITKKFDYLLVNDARSGEHHEVNPYLPSKWSDYAGSTSKSWAFVEDGSSLSQKPATIHTKLGDVQAIADELTRIIKDKLGEN